MSVEAKQSVLLIDEENSTLLLAKHIVRSVRDTKKLSRVAFIGGSEGYTGAPYFSAMAALKVGTHEAHIFCEKDVGQVISTYSPEICVHPILDDPKFPKLMEAWMDCNVFVIGPGMGRKSVVVHNATRLLQMLKKLEKPLIICSDGLTAMTESDVLVGYEHSIIILNSSDFSNVCKSNMRSNKDLKKSATVIKSLMEFPATFLRIDHEDTMYNKQMETVCSSPMNNKNLDPRGEILSGALSVFFLWGCMQEDEADLCTIGVTSSLAACKLMRTCNSIAYKKYGKSMLKMHMIDEIGTAFQFLFGS